MVLLTRSRRKTRHLRCISCIRHSGLRPLRARSQPRCARQRLQLQQRLLQRPDHSPPWPLGMAERHNPVLRMLLTRSRRKTRHLRCISYIRHLGLRPLRARSQPRCARQRLQLQQRLLQRPNHSPPWPLGMAEQHILVLMVMMTRSRRKTRHLRRISCIRHSGLRPLRARSQPRSASQLLQLQQRLLQRPDHSPPWPLGMAEQHNLIITRSS